MVSDRRKPNPDLVIRMVGSGVRPWLVPSRYLSRTLDAVQKLIEPIAEEQGPGNDAQGPLLASPVLHLLDVKSGSAAYKISIEGSKRAIDSIESKARMIADPNDVAWGPDVLSPIKELSEVAASLGCEIELRHPDSNDGVIATIGPHTYQTISESAFIKADTSLYAKIERVGGATKMHCGIRVQDQLNKMVICRVASEDLVRSLGQYIYQNVVVSGTATWYRHNWVLQGMVIRSFNMPANQSVLSALESIYEAGGKSWDFNDDPRATIAES